MVGLHFRLQWRQIRKVKAMLGHQLPKTTARSRVVDRAQSNPALQVPVEL